MKATTYRNSVGVCLAIAGMLCLQSCKRESEAKDASRHPEKFIAFTIRYLNGREKLEKVPHFGTTDRDAAAIYEALMSITADGETYDEDHELKYRARERFIKNNLLKKHPPEEGSFAWKKGWPTRNQEWLGRIVIGCKSERVRYAALESIDRREQTILRDIALKSDSHIADMVARYDVTNIAYLADIAMQSDDANVLRIVRDRLIEHHGSNEITMWVDPRITRTVRDQSTLRQLALHAKLPEVRCTAVLHLHDQMALCQIAKDDKDEEARRFALGAIRDREFLLATAKTHADFSDPGSEGETIRLRLFLTDPRIVSLIGENRLTVFVSYTTRVRPVQNARASDVRWHGGHHNPDSVSYKVPVTSWTETSVTYSLYDARGILIDESKDDAGAVRGLLAHSPLGKRLPETVRDAVWSDVLRMTPEDKP